MTVKPGGRTALLRRFLANDSGSAVARYFVFAALWCACMAAGLHFSTPHVTTNLRAVSAAMTGSAYR